VPPGRVLYIKDTKVPRKAHKGLFFPGSKVEPVGKKSVQFDHGTSRQQYERQWVRSYAAQWTTAKLITEGGLLVSRSMFDDHMPDKQLQIDVAVCGQGKKGVL